MNSENNDYGFFYDETKKRWDSIAKPLDSLGKLEEIVCTLGAIQKTPEPKLDKTALVVFCSDNGIVEEGISQSDQSVTRICAANIAAGKTTVGIMAHQCGTDIVVVDVGVNCHEKIDGVADKKIMPGTKNFLREEAMSFAEMERALETGEELAERIKMSGYDALCVGEMGIGNTTTSAAVAAAVLGLDGESVAGRGAGLSDDGLSKKIRVIDEALKKYSLHGADVKTILRSVGGLDICAMTGFCIGAKRHGIPVVLDGAISLVAALCAEKILPGTKDFLIPSHFGREPLCARICDELEYRPVIHADMALGEGTGAVLFMNVMKTALAVYDKSVRFENSGVEQYERFEK